MTWRPLLEGELARQAEEAVRDIAEVLADAPTAGFSMGGGKAGMALFYGYLARTTGDDHAQRADTLMEQAIDELATTPTGPALYGGFTGVAWAAEHLDGDDMSEEIDDLLLEMLAAPWTGNYDLISGLAGFGVYALERVPRPTAVRCVEAIVDRLHETAERRGDMCTWFTAPEVLPRRNRQQHPHGYYNLGVAHGVPGVISLLASACRLGIRYEKARSLLEGAVRWVLSQRLAVQRGAQFPAWIQPGIEPQPSRLAWCYGDPGIAATLLHAARALGDTEWERAAIDIAARAATTDPELAAVQDPGLCHGALGLAHLYNRFHQAGAGDLFAEAARLWYARGLAMRRPEAGLAGFESWEYGPDMQLGWQADPGFLAGAAGAGLALMAGVGAVEPGWDRVLMVGETPKRTR